MSVVFMIVACALCALVTLYIAAPLRAQNAAPLAAPEERLQYRELREQGDMLRRELRELEADSAEGKLVPADYQTLRAETSQLAEVVKSELSESKIERDIERAIQHERQTRATDNYRSRLEREIEAEIAIMRSRSGASAPKPAAIWACAQCGRKMPAVDKFCASCGTPRPQEGN